MNSTNLRYESAITVLIILGILWQLISFEFAVIAGFAWAIEGISKSNAMKEELDKQN